MSLTEGNLSNRPPAAAVNAGDLYVANDVLETYRSDGSAWTLIGSSGTLLARADIRTMYSSSSTTAIAVPGIQVTFTKGKRPVFAYVSGEVANSSATGMTTLYPKIGETFIATNSTLGIGADKWHGIYFGQEIMGLTEGETYVVKLFMMTSAGSFARLGGHVNSPTMLSIEAK